MEEICEDHCDESILDGGRALGGVGAKGGTTSVAVSSVVPEKSDWDADSMEVMLDSDLATGVSPRATDTTMRGDPTWVIGWPSALEVEKAEPVSMEVTDSEPAGWTETSTPIGLPSWN
jgi:hypothetical protein